MRVRPPFLLSLGRGGGGEEAATISLFGSPPSHLTFSHILLRRVGDGGGGGGRGKGWKGGITPLSFSHTFNSPFFPTSSIHITSQVGKECKWVLIDVLFHFIFFLWEKKKVVGRRVEKFQCSFN